MKKYIRFSIRRFPLLPNASQTVCLRPYKTILQNTERRYATPQNYETVLSGNLSSDKIEIHQNRNRIQNL